MGVPLMLVPRTTPDMPSSETEGVYRRGLRMAKDDLAVAESSASRNLKEMGLHLAGRGLQVSPHEESGDTSDVSRGCNVLPRTDLRGASPQPEPFPNHRITESGKNLSHGVHSSAGW
jgi:hypothetical protein